MQQAFRRDDRDPGIGTFIDYVFNDPHAWDQMAKSARDENTGVDINADGNTPDRANQTGIPYNSTITHHSRSKALYRWFDTSAFCSYTLANPTACPGIGPAYSDATSQRNGYFGPAQRVVDLAILRDFGITERAKFQLRGEATNVFNFVNLNNPNGAINISGTTNQITSGAPMRVIQIGGRLTF